MRKRVVQVLICAVFVIALCWRADFATRDFFAEELKRIIISLDDRVEINIYEVSQGRFLDFLNEELVEVCAENPQMSVSCAIDGGTDLEGIVEVHVGYEVHYLYLGSTNKVYEIKGTMQLLDWKNFLEDLLYKNELKLDGKEVPKRIRGYDVALSEGELNTIFYYDFFKYYTRNIMDFEQFEEGFYLKAQDLEDGEDVIEEVELCVIKDLPEYETEEEMLAFFVEQHSNMNCYEVYSLEDEASASEGNFYLLKEVDGTEYGYFKRDGKTYRVWSKKNKESDYGSAVLDVCSDAGYEWICEDCIWEKCENGTEWSNFYERIFILDKEIADGEKFHFEVRPPEEVQPEHFEMIGWLEYGDDLEVSVYREEEKAPFQTFRTCSVHYESQPVLFRDINADGYLDVSVIYHRGITGDASLSHYIWSQSQQAYVEAPKELGDFYGCAINMRTRELRVNMWSGSLDDVWNIYQWENELDYRLAKRYEYDFLGEEGKTSHRIIWYDEEGNEKDIIKCVMDYSYEKDRTIFSLFADDIMGVAAIKDENTGKEYGLYFGLGTLYKDGKIVPNKYEEQIFVIDEQLCLTNYRVWEGDGTFEDMKWIEGKDGIGNLQILYEDGSIKEFSLEELVRE